uniref:Uncharacterized protein n=1 Tax=Vibrio splendidus TaxID=29497 RepID=A0A0H3ZPC2_VIBSP|nr:hypothetical protein [Vibrio splendidus]
MSLSLPNFQSPPLDVIKECSERIKPEEQVSIFDSLVADRLGHGGKRKGAGRKAGLKSKVVRVPEPLEEIVSSLVKLYKSGDWNNDAKRKEIAKHIETACSLYVGSDK